MNNPYVKRLEPHIGECLTYKTLCEITGDNSRRGYYKDRHIDYLSKFIRIDKTPDGKYLIGEPYKDYELEIMSKSDEIYLFVAEYLIKTFMNEFDKGNRSVVLTNRKILEGSALVASNYFPAKNKISDSISVLSDIYKNIEDEVEVDIRIEQDLNIFFSVTYRMLSSIIQKTVRRLADRGTATYEDVKRLYKYKRDDNGNVTQTFHRDTVTDLDRSRYKSAEIYALNKYNTRARIYGWKLISNTKIAMSLSTKQRKEFYAILMRELETQFGETYEFVSNARKFTFVDLGILKKDLETIREEINSSIVNKMLTTKELNVLTSAVREKCVGKFIEI